MQAASPPIPVIASRLGYAALAPFVLGAMLVWVVWPDVRPYVSHALSAYAAVAVTFLGAVHWGLAMRSGETRRFAWSVVPALIAALAVMMPPSSALVIHGVMLVVCYLVDRRAYPALGLDGWLKLRFRQSALAALSCFAGAAGTPAP
jgi:hypothetical protein